MHSILSKKSILISLQCVWPRCPPPPGAPQGWTYLQQHFSLIAVLKLWAFVAFRPRLVSLMLVYAHLLQVHFVLALLCVFPAWCWEWKLMDLALPCLVCMPTKRLLSWEPVWLTGQALYAQPTAALPHHPKAPLPQRSSLSTSLRWDGDLWLSRVHPLFWHLQPY